MHLVPKALSLREHETGNAKTCFGRFLPAKAQVQKSGKKMKANLTAATIPMLFLVGILGLAFSTIPVQAVDVYTITVNADDGTNPLHVDIQWQNATSSGTGTTAFELTGQTGDVMLEAPPTHIEGSTFYIFSSWSYDETTSQDRTITISSAMTATAHYTVALTVDKALTECYTILDTGEHLACNSSEVPTATVVYFTMRITLHAYTPVTAATVKDGIGADLVLDQYVQSSGDVATGKAGKGKMGATKATWTIGDPEVSADYTLDLYVHTGLNPKQKQEYTSTGMHYLNSGPEVYFVYEEIQYEVQGPFIAVNVVAPPELQ